MRAALEAAIRSAQKNEVPVGAVLVHNGQIVATAHNLTETNSDPTAHAEIVAIRARCAELGTPRLPDHDLYVTLEPCPMCAAAIAGARIARVYFGAYDPKGGGVTHGARIFDQPTCNHKPEVISGVAETESATLLQNFFKDKR